MEDRAVVFFQRTLNLEPCSVPPFLTIPYYLLNTIATLYGGNLYFNYSLYIFLISS